MTNAQIISIVRRARKGVYEHNIGFRYTEWRIATDRWVCSFGSKAQKAARHAAYEAAYAAYMNTSWEHIRS